MGENRLICINPDSTREYKVAGGTFTLGVLPTDIYSRISTMEQNQYDALLLAVKYGVRGHEGLQYDDKTPVDFETTKDTRKRMCMTDKMIAIYAATGLITVLGNECFLKGTGDPHREDFEKASADSNGGTA